MYKDEEILRQKEKLKEAERIKYDEKLQETELQESIYDGKIHLFEEEVEFQRYFIDELGISIMMPVDFIRFADDIVKMMFPSANAPTHVFGSDHIEFQMTFNLTETPMSDEKVGEMVGYAAKILKLIGPKVMIVEQKYEENNGYTLGELSFVSNAIDTTVFNQQYYICVDGKALVFAITFPSKYKKRMIPLAKEIAKSLEIIQKQEV